MNINRLFKIVTVLFIVTAVLALIFGIIALVSEFGGDDRKDKTDRQVTAEETPDMVSKIGGDEALGSSTASSKTDDEAVKPSSSDEKKDAGEKKDKDKTGTSDNTNDADASSSGSETASDSQGTGARAETSAEKPGTTAEGLPIGKSVPIENLKFDGTETHFVLQNINYQVNVRKEASKSSDKVGELLKGSYGIVLEAGEEFSLVKCGDLTGYILNSYLLTGRAADEQLQGVSTKRVTIAKAVFIRDDANMESNKLAIAAEGAVYSVDPTQPEVHGWIAIIYNDAPKAYVSASFCTVE